MWCIVEYQYENKSAYQQRMHNLREVTITSLTEVGARNWFALKYNQCWPVGIYEEGIDWFSYELVGIVEVRLETH